MASHFLCYFKWFSLNFVIWLFTDCSSSLCFCYRVALRFSVAVSLFFFPSSTDRFENKFMELRNHETCMVLHSHHQSFSTEEKNSRIRRKTSILGQQTVNIWPMHTILKTGRHVHFSPSALNCTNSDFIYSVFEKCGA